MMIGLPYGSVKSVIPPSGCRCRPFCVRVLVAEDDPGLRSVLERGLREHGYVVDTVEDGERALAYLRAYEYEAAILDWRMPRVSGLDVVRDLRSRSSAVPVLMLTARDTASDRVTGLDGGADDYLVKPFDFSELLARIRALQRRSPVLQTPTLDVGDVHFDPATRAVRAGPEQPTLTATELSILEVLMRRSPGVVSRRSIALHVWNDEADAVGSNTIDVHLARLRAKLATAHARIETVRGIGYRLVPA
jgi:DNA-binding response OmpR family regulator